MNRPLDPVLSAIDSALAWLPPAMATAEAKVLLVAIHLQEDPEQVRAQRVVVSGRVRKGPARGLWQFEQGGGVKGVLAHAASRFWAREACEWRGVAPTPATVWRALETDDVLAAIFARLLLFTDSRPLPAPGDDAAAWRYYVRNWRPGKPHAAKWGSNHARAREAVGA